MATCTSHSWLFPADATQTQHLSPGRPYWQQHVQMYASQASLVLHISRIMHDVVDSMVAALPMSGIMATSPEVGYQSGLLQQQDCNAACTSGKRRRGRVVESSFPAAACSTLSFTCPDTPYAPYFPASCISLPSHTCYVNLTGHSISGEWRSCM